MTKAPRRVADEIRKAAGGFMNEPAQGRSLTGQEFDNHSALGGFK
jgi:hypothetical protein